MRLRKIRYPYSLNALYRSLGVSKQAVHQAIQRQKLLETQWEALLLDIDQLREAQPGCGVEKMYYTLKPNWIGRDRFIAFCMELGYGLHPKRVAHRTTYSGTITYPNLITGMLLNRPYQVWQSDITYIRVQDQFYYAVFIIDIYTRKIVAYSVSDHLRAEANLKALKMAIRLHQAPEIHHSDRGTQYTSKAYSALLNAHNTLISMGKVAQDNAFAERINRTIKEEYLNHWTITSFNQLKSCLKKAVNHYNSQRIHNTIFRKTPLDFEREVLLLDQQNRPWTTLYTEGKEKTGWISNPPPFLAKQSQGALLCPMNVYL